MAERTIHKDAGDGRIVSAEDAAARPGETYATDVGREARLEASLRGALLLIGRMHDAVTATRAEHGIEGEWLTHEELNRIAQWKALVE